MGTLYFGKQWLTKGGTCCFNNSGGPPVSASGFRLVSTGSGGGGLLTFGKTVGRGGDWFCDCGTISVPFTFTVHFYPDGIDGSGCLLYENYRQDETLTIRYELHYLSSSYFTFTVSNYDNDLGQVVSTVIKTDSGYNLLGGSLQITCTYTAPPLEVVDRSLYMAIYINGIRADTSIVENTGLSSSFASWPQPGQMTVYNSCQYDPEEPDRMQLGIVYEWNRGFTPNEAQELFNVSVNKQPNPSLWGAFFQEPPEPTPPPPFGYLGNTHQRHDTGQTTNSITHDTPLNEWTTTKGIGFRRKSILGAAVALSLPAHPPVCNIPYRIINVADVNFPGNTFLDVAVPRGIQTAVAYCYGRGGPGSESGEGGGCGGFAAGVMDVAGDTNIPANITGSASTGIVSADGGGTPDGGDNNIGDYTSDGGNGGATIWLDVVNYSGGDGCGGAAGGDGYGDTTGQDATGIGQGGGGAGGSTEIAGTPGNGGPGFIQITLCARLGFLHRIHQRHDTGQTNNSISHETPLNLITTTKGIGMRRKWILGAALASSITATLPPPCTKYNYTEFIANGGADIVTTFTVPPGVYEVLVECQGGGAAGGYGTMLPFDSWPGGHGGGGGGYGKSIVPVTPGDIIPITIGAGGVGDSTIGGTTDFNGTIVRGDGGINIFGSGGIGDVVIFGQDGELGVAFPPADGGDGGGAGGPYSVIGFGGAGDDSQNFGGSGSFGVLGAGGGGGGGGGIGGGVSGDGGAGWMRISWAGFGGTLNGKINIHQTHSTGQTNTSIGHSCGLNNWTTTKGIGMRRKWVAAALPTNPTPGPAPIPCANPEFDIIFNLNQPFVTETFANGNNFNWVAPYGVTEIVLQIQGNGQGGAQGGDDAGGCGGNGGGCNYYSYPVTPGQSYPIVIDGTGIDFDSGGILVAGDTSPTGGPTCFLFFGSPGDNPDCPGSGGYGGLGGYTYGIPGENGALGGGGGGGGPGASGGYGGEGWVRIFYVSQFGFKGGNGNSNHYVTATHQTHQTGQTNSSIPHCVPLNQWTTTQGMSVRNKRFVGSALSLVPNEFLTLPCARVVTPVTFIPTDGDINTTWTVPNGVCQILVECQGDGGEGQGGSGGSDGVGGDGGQGGHGGGYGSSIINVFPGTIYNINITEGSGALFQTQFLVTLVAGYSGNDNIAGGLGDLVYDGNPGAGGSPGYPQVGDVSGNGGNGGDGGTSGYNSGGGGGGLGEIFLSSPPTDGGPGANYGGGGGGGGGADGASIDAGDGGAGGMGFVRISWHSFYGLKSPRICPPEED